MRGGRKALEKLFPAMAPGGGKPWGERGPEGLLLLSPSWISTRQSRFWLPPVPSIFCPEWHQTISRFTSDCKSRALALQHSSERTKPLNHQLWPLASNSQLFHLPASLKQNYPLDIGKVHPWNENPLIQGTWCPLMPGHTKNFISYIRLPITSSFNLEFHWTGLYINDVTY